jgi:hypothetical protein
MSEKDKNSDTSKILIGKDDRKIPGALPGWPGYRTRDGRSGYDPIDSRTEAAHTFGTFLQKLLTGKLRIRNPVYLFFLGVSGFVLLIPLFIAILEMVNGNLISWDEWIFLLITGMIGLAMMINFIKSLVRMIFKQGR